jgi:hypothetical protein
MKTPKCSICHDTGWKHDPYCELGACNPMCRRCPNGCPQKSYTPNGDEAWIGPEGPVIIRRER